MAGKSSRITVDLGSAELAKAVRMAAVESGRSVRDIVVEALSLWLERESERSEPSSKSSAEDRPDSGGVDPQDYRSMIEALNKYRGIGER